MKQTLARFGDPFFEIDAIVLSEFAKTEDFKARMDRAQKFLLREIKEAGGRAP